MRTNRTALLIAAAIVGLLGVNMSRRSRSGYPACARRGWTNFTLIHQGHVEFFCTLRALTGRKVARATHNEASVCSRLENQGWCPEEELPRLSGPGAQVSPLRGETIEQPAMPTAVFERLLTRSSPGDQSPQGVAAPVLASPRASPPRTQTPRNRPYWRSGPPGW